MVSGISEAVAGGSTPSDVDSMPVGDDDGGPAIELSVIIPTYNAREVLADCLTSIYENLPNDLCEIIVVDDASEDSTSEMVRDRFPEVRLFRNEINRHYTRSTNLALQNARGKYIYLLNNDTIVLRGAIDRMLAFLREHPEAGAVGSRLLNEDGSIQWSVRALPDLGSALFGGRSVITRLFPNNRYSRRRLLHPDRDITEPFVAGYLSGASKMMPRWAIDAVGYLDTRMFYHVDADYCRRISEAGYLCYYLPTATVIHLNHRGGTRVNRRLRFHSLASFHFDCYAYYRKHLQGPAFNPLQIVVATGLVLRFLTLAAVQTLTELFGLGRSLYQRNQSGRSQV
jgi:N-acetylglucosaminyl-diphospho-decaprenol L-rhamnosyltransferase